MPCAEIVHKRLIDSPAQASAALLEESAQKRSGFLFANASEDVGTVMAGRLAEQAGSVNYAAALRVLGSEADRVDTCEGNGRGAHRARLERHPDRAAIKPRSSETLCRRADGYHFRVSGRIEAPAHGVASFGDNVLAQRHDGAHRHLVGLRGLAGEGERTAHRFGKREAHAARLADGAPTVDEGYCALFVTASESLPAGLTLTVGAGTVTLVCFAPTLTVPVSTSNAGA